VILGPEDEAAFLAYCDANPDETIWLRVAWSEGDARFAAALREGRIAAVAAHDRRGVVHVHAREALAELALECRHADLPAAGLAGPPEQVDAARAALGLEGRQLRSEARQILMALDLPTMVLPASLSRPGVVVRQAGLSDLALLLDWYDRFFREMHGMPVHDQAALELMGLLKRGQVWMLLVDGEAVNAIGLGAVFPELVLVEWSFSPRELRTRGYGRAGVAGPLWEVRKHGVRRAVFTTGEDNLAVQGAVHPVGFRAVGKYRVELYA
jgi:hypothetical protein